MKISLKWLKQFIDFELTIEEFTDKLTFSGIEVEEVIDSQATIKDIIVGKIVKVDKHPDAEKLCLCTVFDGKEEFQVVCGAPNCREGMLSAFAPVGAEIGDFKIKKAKLRGQESCGMLCSSKELLLNNDHSGIMELPDDVVVGTPLSALGYGDIVVDVEITPNRPDLLGMVGLARDIAAILGKPYKLPEVTEAKFTAGELPCGIKLINKVPEASPRFILSEINDVTVSKEMPPWMSTALDANGVNKVSDLVGVTNYLLLEQGQPMHAYDLDKIEGGIVEVRFAKNGETIEALNGKTYELRDTDLVIADGVKILSIAGIIGGKSSAISLGTKNVLLEIGNFYYPFIHKTSHHFKIFTDASYRNERDLSPKALGNVLPRATQMMAEVGKGKFQTVYADSCPEVKDDTVVSLRPSRVRKFLNVDIPTEKIITYLTALEMKLLSEKDDLLEFSVPYFRGDVYREIDLIEEIIRLHGYNNVSSFLNTQVIGDRFKREIKRKTEDFLVLNGLYQAINTSFVSEDLSSGSVVEPVVELINPLGSDMALMRRELLPQLLRNVELNLNKGQEIVKLFELNKVYFAREDGFANEPLQLAMVACGKTDKMHWLDSGRDYDIYDLKGIVEDYLASLGEEGYKFVISNKETVFDSSCSLDLEIRGQNLGSLGRVNKAIAKKFGIKKDVFALIFDFEKALPLFADKNFEFVLPQKYPSVKRDLSIVIDLKYTYEEIKKAIETSSTFIQSVELYDKYEGKGIDQGKRSLTFALNFFSREKTLTDSLVAEDFEKIVCGLDKNFGANLR